MNKQRSKESLKFFYDKKNNTMSIVEITDSLSDNKPKRIKTRIKKQRSIKMPTGHEIIIGNIDLSVFQKYTGHEIIIGNIDLSIFQAQINQIEIEQIRQNIRNIIEKWGEI
jgi:hypothetical protein